jgi:O-antigen ligase
MAFRMVLGTGSRGALVAIAAAFVFILLRATVKQKIATLVLTGVLAAGLPFFVEGGARDRLMTLFADNSGNAELRQEARESADLRRYLLEQSLLFTVQNPILGVGLGQFSNDVGKKSRAEGMGGGAWNETHNTFTEVSSECGIPALIFFVIGIGSAFFSVYRIHLRAKRARRADIADACFCYLLSMFSYITSIIFLANAYRFYLPAMIGLSIALSAAAERELSSGLPAQPVSRSPPAGGPVPSRLRLGGAGGSRV